MCPPPFPGVFLVQSSVCRGAWPSSYHTQRSCGQEGEAEPDQLRVFCFHGGSARYSPKQVSFTTTFQQRSFSRVLQTSEQIVQQFSCADCFTIRFPHPFHSGLWLTENPATKCVSLGRPSWLHSVIPRKGALRLRESQIDLALSLIHI